MKFINTETIHNLSNTKMSEEDIPSGPSLGGPNLDKESNQGPSISNSTPNLKATAEMEKDTKEETRTSSKSKVNVHELVRRWGVARRRVRDGLQTMMLREMKTKVNMTKVNMLFGRNIAELMQGHLDYFDEMKQLIREGADPLSKELIEAGEDRQASTVAFENLEEIVEEELERFKEEKPVITEYIDNDLKRFRDARVEPRAAWWVIWYSALQMRELREKSGKELNIILDVMLRYKPVMRRVLGVFINFLDCLMLSFENYPLETSRMNLIYNPAKTGYNLASWIKPRYGTYSQSYMEYERFLKYYARSFGTVSGNAPDFEGGPLHGYRRWIQDSLSLLEERLRASTLITSAARGDTLEGMLVGLEDQVKDVLKKLEYDDNGKVTNQPVGIEDARDFIRWLFETALHRYDTTNIAIQEETRLHLDMFNWVKGTVRWVNEYSEQLVMDWLDPDLD